MSMMEPADAGAAAAVDSDGVRGWEGRRVEGVAAAAWMDAACIGSDCRRQINDGVFGESRKIKSTN